MGVLVHQGRHRGQLDRRVNNWKTEKTKRNVFSLTKVNTMKGISLTPSNRWGGCQIAMKATCFVLVHTPTVASGPARPPTA